MSDHADFDLDGRRIVVTGAGTGLGAAYAAAAAAAGASVVVNDLDAAVAEASAERIRAAGGTALAAAGDISDWATAEAIVARCVDEFGGIDGLVNNAGWGGRLRSMLEETEDVVRKLLDVNVVGTVAMGVHAARAMVAAGTGGAIVNVTSGNQCGHALLTTYGGTKGAVASLTYAWSVELAEHGIRVNAISPNAHTAMIDDMVAQLGYNPEDREYPLKEHNAAVVAFLLSAASDRLSGQVVRVDRGFVSVMSHPLVINPRVPMTDWSIASLAEAFDGPLAENLQPLGIAMADIHGTGGLH